MHSNSQSEKHFDTPILFQFYNREDTTLRVFNEIRKIKPQHLFLVQDGARNHQEAIECRNTRENILACIDWKCNLYTNFRDTNLGPGKGTAEGIKWFFNQVEMGIVLEHDCLPNYDFFIYCEELLKKYENVKEIKLINGSNFQEKKTFGNGSYYFGRVGQIWGWAAWKRTFTNYYEDIKDIDYAALTKAINRIFRTRREREYWKNTYHLLKNRSIDTWDYQLLYSVWQANGIIIFPNKNLISNIGFHPSSVHCKDPFSKLSRPAIFEILPLIHPKRISVSQYSTTYYYDHYLGINPIRAAIINIKTLFIKHSPSYLYSIYKKIKYPIKHNQH